jgi:phosphatidylglycerol:prolipoprotein diacylglycerol transferase
MTPYLFSAFLAVCLPLGMWITERRSSYAARMRRAYLAGIGGGIVGARLWFALQYGDYSPVGGWASWGFVLGASAGAVLWIRWETGRAAFGEFADAVAPALALCGGLMRLACFWTGCNFGTPTDLPWGVVYGQGSPAFLKQVVAGQLLPTATGSLPVHPAQLYESLGLFALAVLLFRAPRNLLCWRKPGELFLTGIGAYSVLRFFLEFLRDDAGGVGFGIFTFAQATSLMSGFLVVFLFFFTRSVRRSQLARSGWRPAISRPLAGAK